MNHEKAGRMARLFSLLLGVRINMRPDHQRLPTHSAGDAHNQGTPKHSNLRNRRKRKTQILFKAFTSKTLRTEASGELTALAYRLLSMPSTRAAGERPSSPSLSSDFKDGPGRSRW
ncbi:hypothetical protein Pla22_02280 [Rubripirellula amarantea]|uniref:Uncharacterized protein n=1 Tax=Rubripirellula amarantea TaxID=2527999 RepID=A0A5C5WP45_9BACT|nr:hypothetical protein Pla22_02280 [Rubripirellula amarantea]